jgi:hypothetical protein
MVDVKPEIFENPALGSANGLPYLDDVTEQRNENLAAKREGRDPVALPPVERFSNESTNMTLIRKTNGDIVDPSVKTPGLAYFHPSQLVDEDRVTVPKQEKNNVSKSPAPTAKAANSK